MHGDCGTPRRQNPLLPGDSIHEERKRVLSNEAQGTDEFQACAKDYSPFRFRVSSG
jgi:hypothetical protein